MRPGVAEGRGGIGKDRGERGGTEGGQYEGERREGEILICLKNILSFPPFCMG